MTSTPGHTHSPMDTTASRVEVFAALVSANSHIFAADPHGVIALARNQAFTGPVSEQASELAERIETPWLARDPRPPQAPGRPVCLRTLQGHFRKVTGVAVTADGRIALSASEDRALRLWNAVSGACLRVLRGHADKLTAVAMTPDGTRAVSASEDKTLRVWDPATGKCVATLNGHNDTVTSVAMTPDGAAVLSASEDRTLRLWDATTGACLRTFEGHSEKVLCVAITPDGKLAASGSADTTIRIWDVATGKALRALRGDEWVTNVALTPDGRIVMSGGWGGTLRLWDVASGACLRNLDGHTYWVTGLALSAGGTLAVSASDDQSLRAWDLGSGQCVRILRGHTGGVTSVALSANYRLAVSSSADGSVRVWDLATGVAAPALPGHAGRVRGIVLAAGGEKAVSASADRTLRIWEVTSGKCLRALQGHTKRVSGLALTPDGTKGVSSGWEAVKGETDTRKVVRVWDVASGKILWRLHGHVSTVLDVAVTPDSRIAVSASWGRLRVWDLKTGACLRRLCSSSQEIARTSSEHPNSGLMGKIIFTGRLRDSWRRQPTQGHTEGITNVTLAPDGRKVISSTWDKSCCVWDLRDGACLATVQGRTGLRPAEAPTEELGGIALAPDGEIAVSVSWEQTLDVWNVATGRTIRTLDGENKLVERVLVHPDGRLAISAGYDKTLRIWDIRSGAIVRELEGHRDGVNGAVLTRDGKTLLSAGADHTLRVWDLASGACLATYHARASVTSASEVRHDGRLLCGTSDGEVHFLTLHNRTQGPAIATAARLWRIRTPDAMAAQPSAEPLAGENQTLDSSFDDAVTFACPWCAARSPAPAAVLDLLASNRRQLRAGNPPCLALPDNTWEEPRLLSACPQCRRPLRFNPFVVDNRDRS